VTKGQVPACVETCVAKTRFFGEINDLMTLVREKRAKRVFLGGLSETAPSVVYSK
jgi:Fe-S-cluster-containing dehydrogenase component